MFIGGRAVCGVESLDASYVSRQTQRVTILLVPDEDRLNRLKDAIQSAGFRTISAQSLDAAWTRTDFFDFGAVVDAPLIANRGS